MASCRMSSAFSGSGVRISIFAIRSSFEGKYAPAPSVPSRPFLLFHLRQDSLCLGQREGHLHGAVRLDGGGQLGAGLLPLAGGGVQGAKAQVTVSLLRAHAQFFG